MGEGYLTVFRTMRFDRMKTTTSWTSAWMPLALWLVAAGLAGCGESASTMSNTGEALQSPSGASPQPSVQLPDAVDAATRPSTESGGGSQGVPKPKTELFTATEISLIDIEPVEIVDAGFSTADDMFVDFRSDGALCVGGGRVAQSGNDVIAVSQACRPGEAKIDLVFLLESSVTSENPSPAQTLRLFTTSRFDEVSVVDATGEILCHAAATRFDRYDTLRAFACSVDIDRASESGRIVLYAQGDRFVLTDQIPLGEPADR